MRCSAVAYSLLLVTTIVIAGPAQAIDRFGFARFCFEEIIEVPPEIGPVPVGCEVVDCCPGCPGPRPLDWRVRVMGETVESMVLRFENLPEQAAQKIKIDGKGKWVDENRLVLGPGTTLLRGMPEPRKGRVTVALPELTFDKQRLRQSMDRMEDDARSDRERVETKAVEGDFIEVVFEQLLGPVVVNSYRVRYVLRLCPPPVLRADTIDLDNNAANDSAVVLLDGRRSGGCVDDQQFRGSNVINVGNVLARGSCNSEAAVFSDDDAFQLVENVGVWTNSLGDTLKVNQTPDLLEAPVSVWLIRSGAAAAAATDVAQANMLYNTSNCGTGFTADIQDVSDDDTAVDLVMASGQCSSGWIANLTASAFYDAGRLNVYYTNNATTAFNCIQDRNISVVGTGARPASLAHEFGHAYTLGHTNTIGSIPTSNVMHGGGTGRTEFTEGQCFRINANAGSVLNGNGVRSGPTRNCPDGTTSVSCPALDLDVTPN